MAEYIEREAAIAVIEEKQKELCPVGMYSRHAVYGSDREKFDAWQEIIETLEAIPAAEVRPVKWIPVTERLPEEHVFVLIRQDDDRMMIAVRVDGDWWYRYFAYDVDHWDENEQGTITHWMPLPQPPKEE